MANEFTLPRVNGFEMVAMGAPCNAGWRTIVVFRGTGRGYVTARWKDGCGSWLHGTYDLTFEEAMADFLERQKNVSRAQY